MTLVGALAACSGQVITAVGAGGVGGSGGASPVSSSGGGAASSSAAPGSAGSSTSSGATSSSAGGTSASAGGGATSTSSGMSDAGPGADAGCAMSLFYDDSCDKPTVPFSTFTQMITIQGTGTIEKLWAGIGSWSQPWTYTLTLATTQQTATYPNLVFSPRMDQGYMPCAPLNNMAGAALPTGFPVSDGESLTITVSGTGGDLQQDGNGEVRMALEGSQCGE